MDFLRRTGREFLDTIGLSTASSEAVVTPRAPNDASPSLGGPDRHSAQDIIRVALLLRERLPGDLIPIVLDYAQLWQILATSQCPRADRVGELQSPKLQTALLVPSFLPRGSIRRVRFTTKSRDQGWSSFLSDQGTYRGSWTWFEAGIRGLDPLNNNDQATIRSPVDCVHRNALDSEHKRLCMPEPSNYKYGGKTIITNVHAGRDFAEHVVEWNMADEDKDIRNMLMELGGGHRIEVSACARFPGWCNYVEMVTIAIECAVVRKM